MMIDDSPPLLSCIKDEGGTIRCVKAKKIFFENTAFRVSVYC